jgi:hypothetical protein
MAALFAVTFNFLQPLAHAASLRDGSPRALWSVFCNAAVADPDHAVPTGDASLPSHKGCQHECCLGLAHAPAMLAPSPAFTSLLPIDTALPSILPAAERPAVAVRAGPTRPRGPPYLV